MKIHRFYIENQNLNTDFTLFKNVNPDLYNQIKNVLHLMSGEILCLFSNDSLNEYFFEIKDINNKSVSFGFIRSNTCLIEQSLRDARKIKIYMSIIKKDNFEYAVSKACELGATEVQPIITDRTQNKQINKERLQKIIKESAEQCGRTSLLTIHDPLSFNKATEDSEKSTNYACIINANLKADFNIAEDIKDDLSIWIGPEGGWTEDEEKTMKEKDFRSLNLGPTVQRAETSVISSIAILQNLI